MKELICSYCGQKREKVMFMIGACPSDDPDWTMWEGTGKVSCPNCEPRGREEGRLAIEKATF